MLPPPTFSICIAIIDAAATAEVIEGCYMTGVGDTANNSVAVNYDAIVTPLSVAATEATIASVVFIVEWDTAA